MDEGKLKTDIKNENKKSSPKYKQKREIKINVDKLSLQAPSCLKDKIYENTSLCHPSLIFIRHNVNNDTLQMSFASPNLLHQTQASHQLNLGHETFYTSSSVCNSFALTLISNGCIKNVKKFAASNVFCSFLCLF